MKEFSCHNARKNMLRVTESHETHGSSTLVSPSHKVKRHLNVPELSTSPVSTFFLTSQAGSGSHAGKPHFCSCPFTRVVIGCHLTSQGFKLKGL